MVAINHFQFGNLVDTPVSMVFFQDGSIAQVNTNTAVGVQIAPPGTIFEPQQDVGVAQWGSQYMLMCAPQTNGYFIWDGKLFYESGTIAPTVTIANGGQNYTGQPIIQAVGGFGSGAGFTATLNSSGNITQITPIAVGSGYLVNDFVYLAFSSGGSNTSAIATAHISGGGVQSVSVVRGGNGYNQFSATVSFVGGGGFGATGGLTITAGAVAMVNVSTTGVGYVSPPTVVFNDPDNFVAQATVNVMPFGVSGSALETYAGRVWIVNGGAYSTPPVKSLVQFSAPSNPADFSVLDGAGAFISSDSFLRVGFHAVKQTNGFLYLGGDSSWNYISGVNTSGNPPITTFSNLNVNPQIGTPWSDSVQVFNNSILFANTTGIYELIGGAVRKISYTLDGFYTSVPAQGTQPSYNGLFPSSALAIIFGISCYVLLLPIVDPITLQQRNALILYDGQHWWTASQSVPLIRISAQEINSVLTAWGTDGIQLYKLFQAPSHLLKTVQSKLWDNPHYSETKNALRLSGLFKMNIGENTTLNTSIDTVSIDASVASAVTFQSTLSAVTWVNNAGAPVAWVNNSGASVTWVGAGTSIVPWIQFTNIAGVLMGMTIKTNAMDMTLVSESIIEQQYSPKW